MNVGALARERHLPDGAVVGIHPRLAERLDAETRSRGRRRRRKALAVAATLAALVGGYGFTRSGAVDVDRRSVLGTNGQRADEVRTASGIGLGSAMVDVDLAAAAERIEGLPWVSDAALSRSWPGTITITVVERVPVATMGRGSTAVLVDAEGQAIGPVPSGSSTAGAISVAGSAPAVGEQASSRARRAITLAAELPEALGATVERISTDGSALVLELDGGVSVDWGVPGRTSAKADALARVLDQAGRSTIVRVDVSVPSAPAVTRKQGAEP